MYGDPKLIFLMERKIKARDMETLKWKLGFGNGIFVEGSGLAGGLAWLWKASMDVSLCSYSTCHIDDQIKEQGTTSD